MEHADRKESGKSPRQIQRRAGERGASLGLDVADTPALIQRIQRGFSFNVLLRLAANSGLSQLTLASSAGIPERTLARRRAAGKFDPTESERLLRIANLFEKSVDLFEGDVPSAVKWLTTPKKALGSETPLLYARTEPGARAVEDLIGRLNHGVFS
jgi:putative toxin-antitoxin system antitoxin component (TIGR02293 family)